jgi:hypothetical protein
VVEQHRWLPLSVRQSGDSKNIETFERLAEGVPEYARASLVAWFEDYIKQGGARACAELALVLERGLHRSLGADKLQPLSDELYRRMYFVGMRPIEVGDFLGKLSRDPVLLLDAVDLTASAMARNLQVPLNAEFIRRLPIILDEAGLEVMLLRSETFCGLVRRVDVASAARVTASAAIGDRAAAHLTAAWAAAYGRRPNPSEAYREAVRAVEAVGKPTISPNNPRTSVGTMKRDLEAKPEKWGHILGKDAVLGVRTAAMMMGLLWDGQLDRHGTDESDAPLNVSAPQAEAAVHLALTLVEWFRTGALHQARGRTQTGQTEVPVV